MAKILLMLRYKCINFKRWTKIKRINLHIQNVKEQQKAKTV